MNRVFLTGRLTKAPELRRTEKSGKFVATLRIAVDRPRTDGQADFLNVTLWEKAAENACRYLEKGALVAVEAHLSQRTVETEDGRRDVVDVAADRVEYLSHGAERGGAEP